MDVLSLYHKIVVDQDSILKTAFVYTCGQFEYEYSAF